MTQRRRGVEEGQGLPHEVGKVEARPQQQPRRGVDVPGQGVEREGKQGPDGGAGGGHAAL